MNRRIVYTLLLPGILSVVFFSCKKEKQPMTYLGYDYFPNNVGHYVIYQCDSIIVNPFKTTSPKFDTFQYQIKEVIDSLYQNNQGQWTQRIVRYKRTDTAMPWGSVLTPEKVWTGTLLSTMAVRLEDNNNYIKLVFPMKLNEQWNGNAMNNIGTWNYQYTALHTPATINGTTFDSTLTVLQILNNTSFLNYQYYYEQYATGVGRIFRQVIDYTDTSFVSIPPPANIASSGTILYTETYLSSGNQ